MAHFNIFTKPCTFNLQNRDQIDKFNWSKMAMAKHSMELLNDMLFYSSFCKSSQSYDKL